MAKTTNPFTFLQQVRSETAKVTWPSRRETLQESEETGAFAALAMSLMGVASAIGVPLVMLLVL